MGRNRYETVAQEIRQLVDRTPHGERLPSIRALMTRFSVSQNTIDRSLAQLMEHGCVVRRPGSGYFAARTPAVPARRRIGFCFCYHRERMDNPLYGAMITRFLQYANEHRYALDIFACDELDGVEPFRERFETEPPDSCVMLGCTRQSFVHVLRDLKIPVVQLYPNLIVDDGPSILIDNRAIIAGIMDHLARLGHRRIAMLHGQGFDDTYMLDQEERMENFYREMRRRGLPCAARAVSYGGFDSETGYRAALELLDTAPELRPSAIVGNDYIAAGVYRAAAELGLAVPRDLSVVGIDNLPLCAGLSPMLTSVDIEWDAAVDLAADLLDRIGRGEQAGKTVLRTPVRLIERASTAEAER